MFEVMEESTGKVLGLKINGKLLHEDYQQLVPQVEALIEEHGSIRCLVEMADFHGIELRALWDEIKFDVRHSRQIERCAIVGDRAWHAWMTNLSRPLFPRAEMKYFELAERDEAWRWVKEGL